MNIKHFIKRYPITIVFTLILSISIMTIIIQGKVYASSDTKSNAKCYCNVIFCSKDKHTNVTCSFDTDTRKCFCEKPSICECTNAYKKECTAILPPSMCCWKDSCVPHCSPEECSCQKYSVRSALPCTGSGTEGWDGFVPAWCGTCSYEPVGSFCE